MRVEPYGPGRNLSQKAAYFLENKGFSGKRGGLERGTSAVPNPDRGRLRRSADRTLLIFAWSPGAL